MPQLSATIHGRVQGVFFRASTQDEARRLGLRGWVRNRPDGTVEVLAEGERAALGQLLNWLHRGPPGAKVDEVQHQWLAPTGGSPLDGFHVRY